MKALIVLVALTVAAAAEPRLQSAAAIAIDASTGEELFAKRADDVRPIASMTKLFAAMVIRDRRVKLDKPIEIIYDDAKAGIGGANTLLIEKQTFLAGDLFAAMMLVSDNRVPTALARAGGLSPDELLVAMRRKAKDLGLSNTQLDDVTGISGNASTAREMALAIRAALRDPVIARYASMRYATVWSASKEIKAEYKSTVGPLFDRPNHIVGGKTGHTEAAGYCMVIETKLGDRTIAIALLGAPTRDATHTDYDKLVASLAK